MEEKREKSRASMIIDGDMEPETEKDKGLLNLRKRVSFADMDKETLREISKKGRTIQMEMYGKKKTARQALEAILKLRVTDEIARGADIDPAIVARLRASNPEATIYDLINAVAVGRALDGSIPAMQYVRDTAGDKPVDKVEMTGDLMTDADRAMIQAVADRLQDVDVQIVHDATDSTGK